MVGLQSVGIHHRGEEGMKKPQKIAEELPYKEEEEEEPWLQNRVGKMELPHLLLAKIEVIALQL